MSRMRMLPTSYIYSAIRLLSSIKATLEKVVGQDLNTVPIGLNQPLVQLFSALILIFILRVNERPHNVHGPPLAVGGRRHYPILGAHFCDISGKFAAKLELRTWESILVVLKAAATSAHTSHKPLSLSSINLASFFVLYKILRNVLKEASRKDASKLCASAVSRNCWNQSESMTVTRD